MKRCLIIVDNKLFEVPVDDARTFIKEKGSEHDRKIWLDELLKDHPELENPIKSLPQPKASTSQSKTLKKFYNEVLDILYDCVQDPEFLKHKQSFVYTGQEDEIPYSAHVFEKLINVSGKGIGQGEAGVRFMIKNDTLYPGYQASDDVYIKNVSDDAVVWEADIKDCRVEQDFTCGTIDRADSFFKSQSVKTLERLGIDPTDLRLGSLHSFEKIASIKEEYGTLEAFDDQLQFDFWNSDSFRSRYQNDRKRFFLIQKDKIIIKTSKQIYLTCIDSVGVHCGIEKNPFAKSMNEWLDKQARILIDEELTAQKCLANELRQRKTQNKKTADAANKVAREAAKEQRRYDKQQRKENERLEKLQQEEQARNDDLERIIVSTPKFTSKTKLCDELGISPARFKLLMQIAAERQLIIPSFKQREQSVKSLKRKGKIESNEAGTCGRSDEACDARSLEADYARIAGERDSQSVRLGERSGIDHSEGHAASLGASIDSKPAIELSC
jgi:hypothetical protein